MAVPLWFKLFRYKQDGNKDFIYVKEGLKFLYKILTPYGFDVTILADRGFKSIDLFKFIDEVLQWKYCIRCTKDLGISIVGKRKINKLLDIIPTKYSTKYFYDIKLTAQEYICNMAICKAEDTDDVCFIANNISEPYAIREYKKRFDIEEMFRDFKSNGFNLEDTWSNDIHYSKMLYFCVCIAYSYIISLGVSCTKDKKNNLLGVTKNLKGKKIRIYSLFTTGIKWFKRAYYSCEKKYYLKTCFTIYQG
ncbi:MAG: transposase [Clostridium sp.]|uniref:transposase n=1 Tax=Clostridium sp. TaxID=1506 RepID=UPI002A7530BB|nr:transposase [Clostridium sp.]MDY2631086.1 transposase [Clostridium sp.]